MRPLRILELFVFNNAYTPQIQHKGDRCADADDNGKNAQGGQAVKECRKVDLNEW